MSQCKINKLMISKLRDQQAYLSIQQNIIMGKEL
uniref:Uncharacterized protein n=1 Tax=Anguilla anguilla TaxID=7936 RepID=A0A0E9RU40_ANGAN